MTVVFTNGCFDILHRGHVELLRYCSSIGDQVVVGLNSDDSVTRLKGPTRPIVCQDDRKVLLESLQFVDKVIIFCDDTPINLIKSLGPDIIVKGGDYSVNEVVGYPEYEVRIFEYVKGQSTTKIVNCLIDR